MQVAAGGNCAAEAGAGVAGPSPGKLVWASSWVPALGPARLVVRLSPPAATAAVAGGIHGIPAAPPNLVVQPSSRPACPAAAGDNGLSHFGGCTDIIMVQLLAFALDWISLSVDGRHNCVFCVPVTVYVMCYAVLIRWDMLCSRVAQQAATFPRMRRWLGNCSGSTMQSFSLSREREPPPLLRPRRPHSLPPLLLAGGSGWTA